MNIDLKRYGELKAKGMVSVEREGPDTFKVKKRHYCGESGAELKPTILICDQKGVVAKVVELDRVIADRQAEIDALAAQRAGLLQLLEEMQAAEAEASKAAKAPRAAS